ncbi:branched-chain amino acid transaminase 1 [Prunus dulcis]|uniref:Branched-chain amino acid transaminase 1 n=1 Tax=Prunus dulcis TaxID=3755 RepID=A0A4Y1S175_PRUDU|nr:branched-chain amino acid transaminase 1 [Prunus dulcis]
MSAYTRPLLLGSGPVLGIGPAPEYTFLIFASSIGNWDKVFEAVSKAKARGSLMSYFWMQPLGKMLRRFLHVMFHCEAMPPSPALQAISESAVQSHEADEKYGDAMNWDELEFGVIPTDYMHIMKCSNGDNFSQGHLAPYGKIELSPFSGILNYGQTKDGRVQLFRPEENALRMKMSAERLCMPSPSTHQFLDALKQTVLANKRWAIAHWKWPCSWPGPAPEYTFLIFATPVGNYHKRGSTMNLYIENEVRRATPGGTGGVKSITNYSPVEERDVPLEDVLAADEVFCTGTAVEVTAVASITHQEKGEETVFHKLRVVLKEIQTGVVEDKMGWTMLID